MQKKAFNINNLIIRPATRHDAKDIIKHVKTVGDETDFLTFSSEQFNVTVDEEIKIIANHNSSDNQIFIIAEYEGQIIGVANMMASQKPRLKHIGEFGISVIKSFWRCGVGTAMINYLIDWAKSTEILTKINLMVQKDNLRAIETYKKIGFEVEGEMKRAMYLHGAYHDAFHMGICL